MHTPLGRLGIAAEGTTVTRIFFVGDSDDRKGTPDAPAGPNCDNNATARPYCDASVTDHADCDLPDCCRSNCAGPDFDPTECDAEAADALDRAERQLREYFAGKRRDFDFPTAPAGTPFQQAVQAALRAIPYGETRTYAQIAAQIGQPLACRAVGMANHRNLLPIVVPCHRVVGSKGALTGYAFGIGRKEALLRFEREHAY